MNTCQYKQPALKEAWRQAKRALAERLREEVWEMEVTIRKEGRRLVAYTREGQPVGAVRQDSVERLRAAVAGDGNIRELLL